MSALSIHWLDDAEVLPPTRCALGADSDAPGLLAAGGKLTASRLDEAYRKGIFPWYSEGQPVLWWAPDPRMVLPVQEFRISHSLRKTLRRFVRNPGCEVRIDHDFAQVMRACAGAPREGQGGTWIVDEIIDAYTNWHSQSHRPHSVETWMNGHLVGGLYGVGIGRMFFGESMFARRTDASKIALAALVAFCRAHGITLIDCQQRTGHLGSLGAREISRREFEHHLAVSSGQPDPPDWTYHRSMWAHLGLDSPASPGEFGA